ncbi:MAG TPA: DUF692 domain-containing protein [Chthoniobacterales bacterium]
MEAAARRLAVAADAAVVGADAEVVAEEIKMIEALPVLGVGLGFRAPHFSELFLYRREIDFLEITADHFFDATLERRVQFDLLAEHFTLIPHGLNLSLGTAEGMDSEYLAKFASLVEKIDPPWWSEHLAFTRADGVEIGHLTPLPFTREAVEAVRQNVSKAQERIAKPLILENIAYTIRLPGAEMSEGEFLHRVTQETGCGLLLDVTNLFINSRNLGFDPRRWLDEAPLDCVVQLHYVGAEKSSDEVWIDSHAESVDSAIWELLDEVLARTPAKGAILERDEHIPPLPELLPELRMARELGRKRERWV